MEYNIIIAPSLEVLASEVAVLLPMGWKLKGGILEHNDGFAQQLVRKFAEVVKPRQQSEPIKQQRRTKWIE